MKKVLITGGAGFIGSNLVQVLAGKGYAVTVLDNLSPQVHGQDPEISSPLYKSILGKARFIRGSVTSTEDLTRAIDDHEVIIHLAAETGTGQSMYQVSHYAEVNITGTARMLDILVNRKTSVKKVVLASSRAIYGEGKYISAESGPVYPGHRRAEDMDKRDFAVKYPGAVSPLVLTGTDEESLIHPSSVYGITKQSQEQMVMMVCASAGIAPVALRFQNVYGPGQSLSNPYTGILSIFSTLIKNNKPINIFEDGEESRDFVFIDDVVQSLVLAMEKPEADHEIFNVGTGRAVSVMEIARSLVKLYGASTRLSVTGNYRLGDIRHIYADISKISSRLGYIPKVTIEEGLKKFTDWVNEQEVSESRYEESLQEMKAKGLMK